MKTFIGIFLCFIFVIPGMQAQKANKITIPKSYSNIIKKEDKLYFQDPKTGSLAPQKQKNTFYTLQNLSVIPKGTATGITFDFHNPEFKGTMYYGLYTNLPIKFSYPVIFKKAASISGGKAVINLKAMGERYDIAGWEQSGQMKLGYRIVDNNGTILYDGKINIFGKGPFRPALTITQGPFVNRITDAGAVISFETNMSEKFYVEVNGKKYLPSVQGSGLHHEIYITGLKAGKTYSYTVHGGDVTESYSFKTAPKKGSRTAFTFAYASDSRKSNGGGERNIYGVNGYIIKKMAALASKEKIAFLQFTGDLINGYSSSVGEQQLEYANWKTVMEPYWHYIPFYIGPGNHEALLKVFDNGSHYGISVDNFPFNQVSDEHIFASEFVNPENGPKSEDGSVFDPDKKSTDFPPYKETAYYYLYDNVAMVVLNSNYWYTPSERQISKTGGNPHAYIMDNQLKWLKNTLDMLDKDKNIDHIFVTIHTPAFPNAGHSENDMWYNGNNNVRPWINGKPVKKGIIERRDEFLDLLINKSPKVLALLCGDEHNYTRMLITNKTPRYPASYKGKRLTLKRSLWQITNGSAGAPYYGLEKMPWTNFVKKYTTQYALMLLDVKGKSVRLRVLNPDTLEEIETVVLQK